MNEKRKCRLQTADTLRVESCATKQVLLCRAIFDSNNKIYLFFKIEYPLKTKYFYFNGLE
jgi:hypothetical protein